MLARVGFRDAELSVANHYTFGLRRFTSPPFDFIFFMPINKVDRLGVPEFNMGNFMQKDK